MSRGARLRLYVTPMQRTTMNQQVTIIATLHAQAGKEAALEARMRQMAVETRKEAGCITYDLQRSGSDPREYIMVEYWRDAAAIEAHDASVHMAALVADLPGLLDAPVEIRKFTPVA
jgi:quinol monooxygenase YgiN